MNTKIIIEYIVAEGEEDRILKEISEINSDWAIIAFKSEVKNNW